MKKFCQFSGTELFGHKFKVTSEESEALQERVFELGGCVVNRSRVILEQKYRIIESRLVVTKDGCVSITDRTNCSLPDAKFGIIKSKCDEPEWIAHDGSNVTPCDHDDLVDILCSDGWVSMNREKADDWVWDDSGEENSWVIAYRNWTEYKRENKSDPDELEQNMIWDGKGLLEDGMLCRYKPCGSNGIGTEVKVICQNKKMVALKQLSTGSIFFRKKKACMFLSYQPVTNLGKVRVVIEKHVSEYGVCVTTMGELMQDLMEQDLIK